MARTGAGTRGTQGAPTPRGGRPAQTRARRTNPASSRTGTKNKTSLDGQHGLLKVKAHASLPKIQHGGHTCVGCGYMSHREHPVIASNGKPHPTMVMRGCVRCGTMHPARKGALKHHVDDLDVAKAYAADVDAGLVAKSIDTGVTELQAQDGPGPAMVGHRRNCPRGGDGPCGKEVKGECTRCGATVRDHEALGKRGLNATLLDIRKIAGMA